MRPKLSTTMKQDTSDTTNLLAGVLLEIRKSVNVDLKMKFTSWA